MEAFKREFKRYKQRKPPPDLSDVIDFEDSRKWLNEINRVQLHAEGEDQKFAELGLQPPSKWQVYSTKHYPGFLFIVNPFLPSGQWMWVEKCLKQYHKKPNICNLDSHMTRSDDIWDSTVSTCSASGSCLEQSLLYKLRWVTIGYHYNWDSKTYSQERHTPLPAVLARLFTCFSNALGFSRFVPEAGIINYYHLDSTLSGHTDHSEFDLTAPLFSLSFGQPAVFLLGGKTLEETPVAMYVRSGDLMVMSGETRLAYHAVPKVLSASLDCLQADKDLERDSKASATIKKYLTVSRINMNIRQVIAPGQQFPKESHLDQA